MQKLKFAMKVQFKNIILLLILTNILSAYSQVEYH